MNIDVMSHEQAVSYQAPERYLLAELTQDERQAFEAHYFDCPACFDQVRLGAQFLGHASAVLDPEPEKGWLARMLGDLSRPAPAFASAMLVFAIGTGVYQHATIADLKAPRVEFRYVLRGDQRGGPAKQVRVARKAGLSLSVEFTPKPEFTAYEAQIVTESGRVKYSVPVTLQGTQDSITIALPADALDAGKYSVVVQGQAKDGAKTEVVRGWFDLQFVN